MKVLAILIAVAATTSAQADVAISKQPTQNMSCQAGVCSPTAADAVLNATDLANMLAAGDVKVTTGSGATNIVVKGALGWTSTSRLTLDAIQSVEIDKPVMVTGTGAVTVTTNDGGTGGDLIFDGKGNVTFWDLNSSLIVNGNSYTLVGDIATLASAIANNPSGFYALANDYDASVDGTYSSAPVTTEVSGTVEGLGHTISDLKIISSDIALGLFEVASGTLRDLALSNVVIDGTSGGGTAIGSLLGISNRATIIGCGAAGSITLDNAGVAGGLVAGGEKTPDGTITRSRANVSIIAPANSFAGGLLGTSSLTVNLSYATGRVTAGDTSVVGGLIGQSVQSKISQSYATGTATGGANSKVGGLAGLFADGTIDNSYATGAVKGGDGSNVGGFAGEIQFASIHDTYSIGHVGGKTAANSGGFIGQTDGGDSLGSDYFDIDTSGKSRREGCGNGCDGSVKGKRTEDLQAGLPDGFDPAIWREKKSINGGLPYLLALPPH